ncbi:MULTISPECIES: DUF3592 domain-containing protein [Pseudofrankia]|uniref:DUF3592 domain-containing protein n=1 Tax=Pseudofrankia TaxID=2994363 RepID=UPI000234BD39|nr:MULTISPECIES: DUF3592 domain-containing protein [Pseudofrankia]OHV35910.1 hypothetical protein BCD49_19975 [Pseudofrankia sp. EUN1h]
MRDTFTPSQADREHPETIAALVGLASALYAVTIVFCLMTWWYHEERDQRARAATLAEGTVISAHHGKSGSSVQVRWSDAAGDTHVQNFETRAEHRSGDRFPVLYDPRRPNTRAYPALPGEITTANGHLRFLALAGLVPVLGWWAVIGAQFRFVSRQSARPMTAAAYVGQQNLDWSSFTRVEFHRFFIPAGAELWIQLVGPAANHYGMTEWAVSWQRVMWHPAAASLPPGSSVIIFGDLARSGWLIGPVVVQLADGTRLVPIGSIRSRLPESFVLEPATARTWSARWNRPAFFAFVGAAVCATFATMIAVAAGYSIGAVAAGALAFGVAGAALPVNVWAGHGGAPPWP